MKMDYEFLKKLEEYKSFFFIFYYLIFQEQKLKILSQLKIMDKIKLEILKRSKLYLPFQLINISLEIENN